jgi:hypothetical protein
MNPESLFSLSEHLERLSKDGDPLEVLDATIDFEYFRGWLVAGLGYGDGSKGGRPPFHPVSMFKVLIVQTQHNLSDAKMEFMIAAPATGASSGPRRVRVTGKKTVS